MCHILILGAQALSDADWCFAIRRYTRFTQVRQGGVGDGALTGVHNPDYANSPRSPRRQIQKDTGYIFVDEEEDDDGEGIDGPIDDGC